MGVDLGQARDWTAISILRKRPVEVGHNVSRIINRYELRHLERPPLQTPYPAIVERIRELLREGKIIGKKFGPIWQVSKASLMEYLKKMEKLGKRRGPKSRLKS